MIMDNEVNEIKKKLKEKKSEIYNFAKDIDEFRKARGLAVNGVANLLGMKNHTTAAQWFNGETKPNGRETLKELGFVLGMNEDELNNMLLNMGYPGLYVKNPLDAALRFLLPYSAGNANPVNIYTQMLQDCHLKNYEPNRPEPALTPDMSLDFRKMKEDVESDKLTDKFIRWLEKNKRYFRSYDGGYIPHEQLTKFINLYMNGTSTNEFYINLDLPTTIRNMLNPINASRKVFVRTLRAKLIVFGLYMNMTEREIDFMLKTTKLQLISSPSTRADCIIGEALKLAYDRYPASALENAETALENLEEIKNIDSNWEKELKEFFEEQKKDANERSEGKPIDETFRTEYTYYGGNSLLQYILDIFDRLIDDEYAALRENIGKYTEDREYTDEYKKLRGNIHEHNEYTKLRENKHEYIRLRKDSVEFIKFRKDNLEYAQLQKDIGEEYVKLREEIAGYVELREEIDEYVKLMKTNSQAKINKKSCATCVEGQCVRECPVDAIAIKTDGLSKWAKVDPKRCIGCGKCESVCPESAIEIIKNTKPKSKTFVAVFSVTRGNAYQSDYKVYGNESFLIGKGSECKIRFKGKEEKVSRLHCSITVKFPDVTVKDSGSTNGTLLNGKELERGKEETVMPGGLLRVGSSCEIKMTAECAACGKELDKEDIDSIYNHAAEHHTKPKDTVKCGICGKELDKKNKRKRKG